MPATSSIGSSAVQNSYIDDLKYLAMYQGYEPEVIDEMLREGFSPDEVEEYLYA